VPKAVAEPERNARSIYEVARWYLCARTATGIKALSSAVTGYKALPGCARFICGKAMYMPLTRPRPLAGLRRGETWRRQLILLVSQVRRGHAEANISKSHPSGDPKAG